MTEQDLLERFEALYRDEPLITFSADIPEIRDLVSGVGPAAGLRIGGFSVDGRDAQRAALVVVLDNLLKGAATQALQNLNLALGYDELSGILSHSDNQP